MINIRRSLISLAAFGLLCATAGPTPAVAATPNAQQTRMKTCNADAKSKALAGTERKQFMSTCLSGTAAAPTLNSQQQKMKTCNAEAKAKALKGAQRQQFMSTCLKGA